MEQELAIKMELNFSVSSPGIIAAARKR